ncbi:hypothetical protein CDAR_524991 [Caerostris darwini]|uniref:Uncharacterized protein n=1 Tax=Caerostris darwini TaxID=1538125 RepID=A0AAV4QXB5_9ARAC|nr:hypothetical protein CDAR_524991 [Caerostris darwini]
MLSEGILRQCHHFAPNVNGSQTNRCTPRGSATPPLSLEPCHARINSIGGPRGYLLIPRSGGNLLENGPEIAAIPPPLAHLEQMV